MTNLAAAPRGKTSLPAEIPDAVKNGDVLIGDDFDDPRLERWFAEEENAYFAAEAGNSAADPWYVYMRYVNEKLAFSRLEGEATAGAILSIGPGPGTELTRFARDNKGWKITFVEASSNFRAQLQSSFPGASVIEARLSGAIDVPAESQNVVCAFSVLHHIPNVSKVIAEVSRVLKPGGFLFVREPCSSMGDWRYARSATPNERGISQKYLLDAASRAGLMIETPPVPILFEPINKVLKRLGLFNRIQPGFPYPLLYSLDRAVSRGLQFNDGYWRDAWYKKLAPSSYFYTFRKVSKT